MWHDVGIRWVGESQLEDLFVCFVRDPHKGLAREISHETGRGQGKECLRAEQKKAESRTEKGSW